MWLFLFLSFLCSRMVDSLVLAVDVLCLWMCIGPVNMSELT